MWEKGFLFWFWGGWESSSSWGDWGGCCSASSSFRILGELDLDPFWLPDPSVVGGVEECTGAHDFEFVESREVILEKQLQGHRVDRSICTWFWDYAMAQGGELSQVGKLCVLPFFSPSNRARWKNNGKYVERDEKEKGGGGGSKRRYLWLMMGVDPRYNGIGFFFL